jgi:hypothetical protein
MQLEQGTTAALGPGLPGEPFRVAVHRSRAEFPGCSGRFRSTWNGTPRGWVRAAFALGRRHNSPSSHRTDSADLASQPGHEGWRRYFPRRGC